MIKFGKDHWWGQNTYIMYICAYMHKKLRTLLSIYASITSALYQAFRQWSFASILHLFITCEIDFLGKHMEGPVLKRETLPQNNATFP